MVLHVVNACSTYKCSIIGASGSKHTTPGPSPARCVLPPVWYEQMRHVMNSHHPATTTPQTQTQLTTATVHILLVLKLSHVSRYPAVLLTFAQGDNNAHTRDHCSSAWQTGWSGLFTTSLVQHKNAWGPSWHMSVCTHICQQIKVNKGNEVSKTNSSICTPAHYCTPWLTTPC
jgi:hypothetical protein